MKYIKKLIRNSKRALNQQVIKNKQEIVKYAPRLTGIQDRVSVLAIRTFFFLVPGVFISVEIVDILDCNFQDVMYRFHSNLPLDYIDTKSLIYEIRGKAIQNPLIGKQLIVVCEYLKRN
ncbi:hypothetical protein [Turicimonas muris]|uniref:hypothetical protein n=1 Tax=Turicimonas muris TaxID=1796652 RepID=UPI002632C955|nr:hypothetical protein [Turicimonas muris]